MKLTPHPAFKSIRGMMDDVVYRQVVWLYPASALAPAGERITVSATATDRPGNQATGSAMYP